MISVCFNSAREQLWDSHGADWLILFVSDSVDAEKIEIVKDSKFIEDMEPGDVIKATTFSNPVRNTTKYKPC